MLRRTIIISSFIAAVFLACYGFDTLQLGLWAIGYAWAVIVVLAQVPPDIKKKRRRKSDDTQT